jgi:hypothetical protein
MLWVDGGRGQVLYQMCSVWVVESGQWVENNELECVKKIGWLVSLYKGPARSLPFTALF